MPINIANEEAGREVAGEYSHDKILFYQVSLEGFPENTYTDTFDGVVDTLKYLGSELLESGHESERYVIQPVLMTQQQFDTLPEFTGF